VYESSFYILKFELFLAIFKATQRIRYDPALLKLKLLKKVVDKILLFKNIFYGIYGSSDLEGCGRGIE